MHNILALAIHLAVQTSFPDFVPVPTCFKSYKLMNEHYITIHLLSLLNTPNILLVIF